MGRPIMGTARESRDEYPFPRSAVPSFHTVKSAPARLPVLGIASENGTNLDKVVVLLKAGARGGPTVSTTSLLVTAPAPLLTTTENFAPESLIAARSSV